MILHIALTSTISLYKILTNKNNLISQFFYFCSENNQEFIRRLNRVKLWEPILWKVTLWSGFAIWPRLPQSTKSPQMRVPQNGGRNLKDLSTIYNLQKNAFNFHKMPTRERSANSYCETMVFPQNYYF